MSEPSLSLLRAAVRQNRAYAPAWEHYAREAAKAGKHAQARRAVAGMLKACPSSPALDARASALLAELDQERALLEVRAGRYPAAVRAAESLLERRPDLRLVRAFWSPWQPALRPERAAAHRRAVEPLARRGAPWALYFRGCLSPGGKTAAEDLEAAASAGPRYAWMSLKAGWERLMRGEARAAAPLLERALKARPADWKARGYLAEALICLGEPDRAREQLARARREAGEEEEPQALAWEGGVELWLGRYERALTLLDEARARGAQHAHCWAGGALVMLGRLPEALERLDETVSLFPRDTEAFVWRGEAKRLSGRPREALGDLSRARGWFWAHANAALAHAALGDEARMAEEFRGIAAPIAARVEKRLRRPGEGASRVKRILEEAFSSARGFRRDDYAQAFWLAP